MEALARAGHRFTVAELKAGAKGKVSELNGKIAVVSTGWSNHAFADESRYFGESPTLSPGAACWLAEAKIKAIVLDSATDAADPAPVQEQPCPVHRTFLEHSIPIVENCTDVVKIPEGKPFTIYAIPLKIQGESGAPARVFARMDE